MEGRYNSADLQPGWRHTAARSQSVSFHQLHQCDHPRVKQVLYCQAEDRPVSRAELVRGFEYERDRYEVVDDDELDQMAPPSSRVMEVREFVPSAEIDPVYLDASYYVVPETAGEKPYTLLYEVLRRSGHAAVAQWTSHNREHPVLLRPGRFGLLLRHLTNPRCTESTAQLRRPCGSSSRRGWVRSPARFFLPRGVCAEWVGVLVAVTCDCVARSDLAGGARDGSRLVADTVSRRRRLETGQRRWPIGVDKDRYNQTASTPVTTTALRLEVTMQPGFSAGVQSWRVK